MKKKRLCLFLLLLGVGLGGTARGEVAEILIIDAPETGTPGYAELFTRNTYYYGQDFNSSTAIYNLSCSEFDFRESTAELKSNFLNTGIIRFSNTSSDGVTVRTAESSELGILSLSNAVLNLDLKDSQEGPLKLNTVYGSGTIRNISPYVNGSGESVTTIEGVVSPGYLHRKKETFELSGESYEIPELGAGQKLVFSSQDPLKHRVEFVNDTILAPIIYPEREGVMTADTIEVEGDVYFSRGTYLQPTLSESAAEAFRQGKDITSDEDITILKASGTIYSESGAQQYVWGDATSENFEYDFNSEDGFFSPVLYRADYSVPGQVTLHKEFSWAGNFLRQIHADSTELNKNIREIAWQFNEMLYRGTWEDADGNHGFLTDEAIFRNIASIQDPAEAAYRLKQFTPEVYATRVTLTALSAVQHGDNALEQMSQARQYPGLRSRLGRCGDGDPEVSEKFEHYDPFFAQFQGDRSWYAWANPEGSWMERDTDGLLSGHFGYEYEQYGVNFGIARNLGTVTFGLSGGWQDGSFSARDTYHNIEIDSFQVMLLAAWYCNNWWADGWVGYHRDSDDSRREVFTGSSLAAPTAISEAEYTVQGFSGGFHVGYEWNFSFCSLSPSIGFRFGTARVGDIWEEATHMKIQGDSMGLYEIPIGLRLTKCIQLDNGFVFMPMVKGEWIARFGDQDTNFLIDYYEYQSYIYGAEVPSEFHLNLKMNMMKGNFQFGVGYDGSFADDYQVNRVGGSAGFVF